MTAIMQKVWGLEDSQIKTLVDEQATRDNILKTAQSWLIEGTAAGDELYFYFSGHGYQTPDLNGDEEDGLDETLVAYDSAPEGDGFTNMIIDDEVEELFSKVADRYLVAIFDACHSGTITRAMGLGAGNPESEIYIKMPAAPPKSFKKPVTKQMISAHRNEESFLPSSQNRMVWTAVSASQPAVVDREAKPLGSVFTNRLFKGLVEGAADIDHSGTITQAELLDYLRKESAQFCKRNADLCQFGLTPTLEAPLTLLAHDIHSPWAQRQWAASGLANQLLRTEEGSKIGIETLPGPRLQVGETLSVRVRADNDGYLILLDINPAGEVVQLFPNIYSAKAGRKNLMKKGEIITIPDAYYGFNLTAIEPLGLGKLVAVLARDSLDFSKILQTSNDLSAVASAEEYLSRLGQSLRKVWTGSEANRTVLWSYAEVDYEIVGGWQSAFTGEFAQKPLEQLSRR